MNIPKVISRLGIYRLQYCNSIWMRFYYNISIKSEVMTTICITDDLFIAEEKHDQQSPRMSATR